MLVKIIAGFLGIWTLIWSVKSIQKTLHHEENAALQANDVVALAEARGMYLERHDVITEDLWVLQIHRLRNMKIYDERFSTPVILSHGFGGSSVDFMLNPRNESLAFILADNGFDVWAVNFRGNRFSNTKLMNGTIMAPNVTDYYRSTWQYMAERDMPAILEGIIDATHQSQIHIIGQSMGTTVIFAFLSENHAYDDKIGHFAAISPVIRFGKDTSPYLKTFFKSACQLPLLAKGPLFPLLFGKSLFLTKKKFVDYSLRAGCRLFPSLCKAITDLFFQTKFKTTFEGNPHLKKERISLYLMEYPAGATAMNIYQFASQFNRSTWTKMDYRNIPQTEITNEEEYGEPVPPIYNFSAVGVSLSVHFVRNDVFVGLETAKSIVKELNLDKRHVQIVDGNRLNHIDTIWGWDARCFLYDHIIKRLHNIELTRDQNQTQYRESRVQLHIRSLDFQNGCLNQLTPNE